MCKLAIAILANPQGLLEEPPQPVGFANLLATFGHITLSRALARAMDCPAFPHANRAPHFATAHETFRQSSAYYERRRMQPVCTVKALKKESIMDSKTIGLPAVIIGPKGLRAGWRLLIFLLMLIAMGAVARAIIIRFLIPAGFAPEKFTPSSVAVPDAFFVFIVAVAAWVMSKIERRKIGQYGLPLKQGLMKHLWLE
jgi:hypothetical protein